MTSRRKTERCWLDIIIQYINERMYYNRRCNSFRQNVKDKDAEMLSKYIDLNEKMSTIWRCTTTKLKDSPLIIGAWKSIPKSYHSIRNEWTSKQTCECVNFSPPWYSIYLEKHIFCQRLFVKAWQLALRRNTIKTWVFYINTM